VVAGTYGTYAGSGSNLVASVSLADLAGAGVATNGQPVTLAQLPATVLTNSAVFVATNDARYLAALTNAWQNPASASDWTWTSDGTNITLTGYTGPDAVVVPDMLDGLPVTGFGTVFRFTSITNILGGENITAIGVQAFQNCTSLISGNFPNVTTIGDTAFFGCAALTAVSFPNVTTIGPAAFSSCNALASISLPNATTIAESALASCIVLTSVYFGQNAPAEEDDVYTGDPNVTNYVTNPQATGWGSTWNGRPVVRLPVYADSFYGSGSGLINISAGQVGAVSNTPAGIAAAGGVTNGQVIAAASNANFATWAGSATNANLATWAKSSTNAQWAMNATNAQLATWAGSATNANLATWAMSATNAQTAMNATNAQLATWAGSATNANLATWAKSSTNTQWAMNATNAQLATWAGSATNANLATWAMSATNAQTAMNATNAQLATWAGSATNANYATVSATASNLVGAQSDTLAMAVTTNLTEYLGAPGEWTNLLVNTSNLTISPVWTPTNTYYYRVADTGNVTLNPSSWPVGRYAEMVVSLSCASNVNFVMPTNAPRLLTGTFTYTAPSIRTNALLFFVHSPHEYWYMCATNDTPVGTP
jgi:hypothetical protein